MSSNAGDITPLIRHLFDRARQEAHNKSCWLTAAYWVSTLNSMQNEARFNLHSGSVTVKSFNSAMSDSKYGFPYSVQNLASGEAKMVQQSNMQR